MTKAIFATAIAGILFLSCDHGFEGEIAAEQTQVPMHIVCHIVGASENDHWTGSLEKKSKLEGFHVFREPDAWSRFVDDFWNWPEENEQSEVNPPKIDFDHYMLLAFFRVHPNTQPSVGFRIDRVDEINGQIVVFVPAVKDPSQHVNPAISLTVDLVILPRSDLPIVYTGDIP